jgi:hypothetical protein
MSGEQCVDGVCTHEADCIVLAKWPYRNEEKETHRLMCIDCLEFWIPTFLLLETEFTIKPILHNSNTNNNKNNNNNNNESI